MSAYYPVRSVYHGYQGFAGFASTSGPKLEAEIAGLKAMLVSDMDTITTLNLPLIPAAQAVMAQVARAQMVINREKQLDQWGSSAHDTVVALRNAIVRDQSALATKIATTPPTPKKVVGSGGGSSSSSSNGNGGGSGSGFTTMQMGGGILVAVAAAAGIFFMARR